jgi:hypothetical protein
MTVGMLLAWLSWKTRSCGLSLTSVEEVRGCFVQHQMPALHLKWRVIVVERAPRAVRERRLKQKNVRGS